MKSWLTVSTNGVSTRLCHKWNICYFFWFRFGCVACDWRRNFFRKGDGFPFSYSRLVFLAKQCVPSPPNNIIVGLWSLKGKFKTWQQSLHFLVVETSRCIGGNKNTLFISTCWTIHISNTLLKFVVHT